MPCNAVLMMIISFEVEVLNHNPEDAKHKTARREDFSNHTCRYPFFLLLQNASLGNHFMRSDQHGLQIWARPSV
jgi:hypothetical protein